MLERGVERELHEQVLGRRPARDLPPRRNTSRPQPLGVDGEQARARRDAVVKLDDRPGGGIHEAPRVVRRIGVPEAGIPEDAHRRRPIVEGQDVDVGHGTVGDAVVEALDEGRALEREAPETAVAQETGDPRRGVELANPPDEGAVMRLAKRIDQEGRPRHALRDDVGVEQAAHALLRGGRHEGTRLGLAPRARRAPRDQPLPKAGPRLHGLHYGMGTGDGVTVLPGGWVGIGDGVGVGLGNGAGVGPGVGEGDGDAGGAEGGAVGVGLGVGVGAGSRAAPAGRPPGSGRARIPRGRDPAPRRSRAASPPRARHRAGRCRRSECPGAPPRAGARRLRLRPPWPATRARRHPRRSRGGAASPRSRPPCSSSAPRGGAAPRRRPGA